MSRPPSRISIVDDDSVVRSTLRLMLGRLTEFELVSAHATAADALQVLPDLAPDIVLLDIRMPGMSGLDCARRLRSVLPEARLVMVTAHLEDALIADAFHAGAIGYVVKPFTLAGIEQALVHAREGVIHLEGPVSERFAAWMRERRGKSPALLSEREVEILSCVKRGLSDKEIARHLSVSEPTVKSHLRRILAKLKVSSRSGAVARYFDYF